MRFDAFTGDRLAAKRFAFPKTAYTRLGIPGFGHCGLLSKRAQALVKQIDPELDEFWRRATPT